MYNIYLYFPGSMRFGMRFSDASWLGQAQKRPYIYIYIYYVVVYCYISVHTYLYISIYLSSGSCHNLIGNFMGPLARGPLVTPSLRYKIPVF